MWKRVGMGMPLCYPYKTMSSNHYYVSAIEATKYSYFGVATRPMDHKTLKNTLKRSNIYPGNGNKMSLRHNACACIRCTRPHRTQWNSYRNGRRPSKNGRFSSSGTTNNQLGRRRHTQPNSARNLAINDLLSPFKPQKRHKHKFSFTHSSYYARRCLLREESPRSRDDRLASFSGMPWRHNRFLRKTQTASATAVNSWCCQQQQHQTEWQQEQQSRTSTSSIAVYLDFHAILSFIVNIKKMSINISLYEKSF